MSRRKIVSHEGACYFEGKKVRDNHEWYIDKNSQYCRQCGAKQKDYGAK